METFFNCCMAWLFVLVAVSVMIVANRIMQRD